MKPFAVKQSIYIDFNKKSNKDYNKECFPKPKSFGRRVTVDLDSSNYATKTDLKKMQQGLIHLLKRFI